MEILIPIILGIVGIGLGAGGVTVAGKIKKNNVNAKTDKMIADAKKEASNVLLKATEDAKKDEEERRKEAKAAEKRITERENALDKKLDDLDKRAEKVRKGEDELEGLKNEIRDIRNKQQDKLEKIAKLTRDEAKDKLLSMTERDVKGDLLGMIAKLKKDAEADAEEQSAAILLAAMERLGRDVASERTVTALPLENEEMKGRIIGKEGRNIQALQRATGVDILVDETPGMIVLSSFDPVRRQVARLSLEMLMKDGRIHPGRIEEVVEKAQKQIDKEVVKAGEDAAREVRVVGLPPELIHLLGELKFRTSYGQNVLQHSVEMTQLAGMISDDLGLDTRTVKTATLLHDIGKAVSHSIEGKHHHVGAELAKKYGMNDAIAHAMEAHHDDIEATTPEAMVVRIVDAVSAARPGARNISAENFVERMRDLENVALGFEGIDKAYAISAGREVRVIVVPEKIDDLSAIKLARDIANKIESTMQYPGTIKVNVIRETRATEYAK
ncbi:MAG: ribonuclease Y [Candidatus Nomurabacteria bacterium]|jgi:ribonuclease Y|nr:ribonuclease Y [Candidatus Nomurabacteria bacterium]